MTWCGAKWGKLEYQLRHSRALPYKAPTSAFSLTRPSRAFGKQSLDEEICNLLMAQVEPQR